MFVLASNGKVEKYPLSSYDVRRLFPKTSFCEDLSVHYDFLAANRIFPVYGVVPSSKFVFRSFKEIDPLNERGVWNRQFEEVFVSDETKNEIRNAFELTIKSGILSNVNNFAVTLGFDSMHDAISYVHSRIPKLCSMAKDILAVRDASILCWESKKHSLLQHDDLLHEQMKNLAGEIVALEIDKLKNDTKGA